MRVIDCECGQTLQAATEEELVAVFAAHMRDEHSALPEEEVRRLVAERAYEATDS